MKKTLVLAFLILLGFFITDRLAFAGLRYLDKNVFTGQTSGKVNQFLKIKDTVNTLVFGSSRANHHVDVEELDSSAFNMGVDATKIAYAAALIETLTKQGQHIFVHIDQLSLVDPDDTYEGKDCLKLINIADRQRGVKLVIKELYPEELLITNISKSYMYNGKSLGFLKNFFMPSYNYKNYKGYDPLVPTPNQQEVFLSLWKSEGRDSIGYGNVKAVNPVVEQLIEKIKLKCAANNAKLTFFTSPTLNQINPVLITTTREFFKEKGIQYLDYTYLFEEFNLDYWKDLTHLSAKGAKKFTKKLKSDFITHTKRQIN
jgi:hypothetical protein